MRQLITCCDSSMVWASLLSHVCLRVMVLQQTSADESIPSTLCKNMSVMKQFAAFQSMEINFRANSIKFFSDFLDFYSNLIFSKKSIRTFVQIFFKAQTRFCDFAFHRRSLPWKLAIVVFRKKAR